MLAAGFEFQWVVVWKVATGKVKLEFSQEPDMMKVTAVAFSPDNKALAVGTDKGTVTLWEVESGSRLAIFRGHTTGVDSLAFSPDGNTLVTASADKTVRLWDVLTGQERSTLTGHQCPVRKVQFSPDGSTLATASGDGTVKLWRAATDPEARARRTSVDSDDPHYVIARQYHASAWQLAMSEDPVERDPARAVELAQKAIALFPQSARYWLTLGVAQYRAREWQAAAAAFDKSDELAPGKHGYKDFFRAMALWQLGDREQARDRYERASEWVAHNAPYDPWMSPFQREAAELLELPAPSSLTPALPTGAIVREQREQVAELLRRRAAIDERALSSLGGQEERWKLATECYQLALPLRDLEELSESEAICRQALNAFRNLADEDPQETQSDDDIGWASYLLADVLTRSGRFAEAAALARESLAHFQTLVEIRPDRPEYRDGIHNSQGLLGHVLGQLKKTEEAAHAQLQSRATRQAADELRKLPPAQTLLESARPYAEKRDWKQAAEVLNKGFEQQPRSDFILCYATALARLLAGDVEGYARLAETLPPPKWDRWERLDFLRTRTIHPRGSADAAALVRLARLVYDKEVNSWNAQNLGLAHYRAGEFDEALKRFEEALKLADWYLYWPAVAMTHHQLGHADEARQWLDKSNGLFRHVTESGLEPLQFTKEPYWQDWAYFEVMRQEANALIGREQ